MNISYLDLRILLSNFKFGEIIKAISVIQKLQINFHSIFLQYILPISPLSVSTFSIL
jgi:hypothetical protein